MIYLPFTFELFGQEWHVRSAFHNEIQDLGICNPDLFEIIINPIQNNESITHTLWHEIVHSWETKLDLQLTERQTDLIALSMIHFFRQNPQLIEYLLKEESQ